MLILCLENAYNKCNALYYNCCSSKKLFGTLFLLIRDMSKTELRLSSPPQPSDGYLIEGFMMSFL